MSDEIVYICDRCGERFSLEDGDRHCLDGQFVTFCPGCGSTDFEEACRCRVCRDIHWPSEMRGDVCEDCFADAVSAYMAAINSLQPWEKSCIEREFGSLELE